MIPPRNQESFQNIETSQASSSQDSTTKTREDVVTQIWNLTNELRELDQDRRLAAVDLEFKVGNAQKKYDEVVQKLNEAMGKVTNLASSLNQLHIDEKIDSDTAPKKVSELSPTELLKEAKSFMINQKEKELNFTGLSKSSRAFDYIENTLQTQQGITIGESHDGEVLKLLTDNLPNLKKLGVSTLFLEGALRYNFQKEIDEEKWDKLPQREYEDGHVRQGLREFIVRAHREGIRIVGIETMAQFKIDDGADRLIAFNYVARQIINHEKGEGKFITVLGSVHLTSLYNGAISGVSELTGTPGIEIYRDEEKFSSVKAIFDSRYGDLRRKPAATLLLNPTKAR